jgi:endonuclease YncB( thermonuclease family)
MKHWDGRDRGKIVKLRVPGRDRRQLHQLFGVEPRRDNSLSGTTVGNVLTMAICAGLAWGLWPQAPASSGPDKPILWGETQTVGRAAADGGDAEWAARSEDWSPDQVRESGNREPGARIAFGFCHTGGGTNCVVDGDTFYLDGQKVRIADIDAPETHDYGCASELERGQRATRRLHDLLSSGAIRMASIDRDTDVYGRKLRIVEVNGAGVGETLVDEGLSRWYGNGRRSWC